MDGDGKMMEQEARNLADDLRRSAVWALRHIHDKGLTLCEIMCHAAEMLKQLSDDRDAWKRRAEAAENVVKGDCDVCTNADE